MSDNSGDDHEKIEKKPCEKGSNTICEKKRVDSIRIKDKNIFEWENYSVHLL